MISASALTEVHAHHAGNLPIKVAKTYVSLHDLVPLVRVVQHVDRQVGDGDCSRGGECDQQQQHSSALLQRHVQFVRPFLTEERQVNGAPVAHERAHGTTLSVRMIPVDDACRDLERRTFP